MENENYVSGKEASKILGVHQRTLYMWDKKKLIETIRTPGGKRLYNVEKYLKSSEKNKSNVDHVNNGDINKLMNAKKNICYARVSSRQQKNDLNGQINVLKLKYPEYELITDIGSGINMKRRGLLKIINYAISGKLNELVIVFKDRLCRFGFELIEYLIQQYSKGRIIIINNEKSKKDPEKELIYDILQIMNIFVAKVNGLRKYKKIET